MDTYEKKYKEALELARVAAFNGHQSLMEGIFPELAESKDEKTRKRIIALVNAHGQGMYKDDMLAWLENIPYTIDHEKREGFHLGYKAGLEKQGEQEVNEPDWCHHKVDLSDCSEEYRKAYYDGWNNCNQQHSQCNAEQKPADKVESKFKVKYAGSEYNVLEVKDIAGVTFYGIEDEPNHIDYVLTENCERVGGYAIKENGSPYPTKPAVFSEQKSSWSEDDENRINRLIAYFEDKESFTAEDDVVYANWLKSLKERCTWKPSNEQIDVIESLIENRSFQRRHLVSLYEQLKKLKGK